MFKQGGRGNIFVALFFFRYFTLQDPNIGDTGETGDHQESLDTGTKGQLPLVQFS